jgi:hypothetical protein
MVEPLLTTDYSLFTGFPLKNRSRKDLVKKDQTNEEPP